MADLGVKLERVEKRFPNSPRPALEGISAEIRPGVITGLVGPDGAGKTTLLRLIAGLLLPNSGQVLFESAGQHAVPSSETAPFSSAVPPTGAKSQPNRKPQP